MAIWESKRQPLEHSGSGEGQSVLGLRGNGTGKGQPNTVLGISRKRFDISEKGNSLRNHL